MDPRTPRNTYRVEITSTSPVESVQDRLDRFADMGVDWVRLSGMIPDHTVDAPVPGIEAFSARARSVGLGVLVELGPAAVSASSASPSPWWNDVLTHGQRSVHASAFDIDWDSARGKLVHTPGEYPVNYRRWRGQEGLAALRVEDPAVFEQTYAQVKRWFDQGLIDGVVMDHLDDLWAPSEFLRALRALAGGAFVLGQAGAGPEGVSVETLLPELQWIVRDLPGTGKGLVSRVRKRFGGQSASALGHPTESVMDALSELLICFPASRSHLPEGREHLDTAMTGAAERRPELAPVLDALAPVLADAEQPAARRFEVTAAALRSTRAAAPESDGASGVVEQILAVTMPDMPEVDDLGEDPGELPMAVCTAGLRLRRDRPDLFTTYTPVETFGDVGAHLVAFDRGGAIVVAAPDPEGLTTRGGWGTAELSLPAGDWWDHVTGRDLGSDGRVYVEELLDLAPVALLTRDER